MIKVGIAGLGFMGTMHLQNYLRNKDVAVAAICDTDPGKLTGRVKIAGNISGTEESIDLAGVDLYTDIDEMLDKVALDAISITLPTYLHKEATVKSLNKGIHTLCEKPMALSEADCIEMIKASADNGRILQIGHCIRFWPGYDIVKNIIDTGKYGKVKAATFQRLSLMPGWSWNNWLITGSLSGGASLDMHIHDADYVQYLFGMPSAVRSFAVDGPSKDFDHIVTGYIYNDDKIVTAEGGWMMAPGFGFEMSFNIVTEGATMIFDINKDPVLKICLANGETIIPELRKGDGYSVEIEHFINTVKGEKTPQITTPQQSLDSVKLVLAEKRSAREGRDVKL